MKNPLDEDVATQASDLPEALKQTVDLVQQRQIKIMTHASRLRT